jgi:NAD(P)-dependent dehydrogenase (short-subunit alcohol dehydrogenase family)
MSMTFSLCDRVALVTGSGRGIGAAVARRLAAAGAAVYVADLATERAEEVAHEISAAGGTASAVPLDVTEEKSWAAAISLIQERSSYLDVLVNNVGVTISKSVEDTTLADWRLMMTVNLEAPFIGVKASLPLMKESAKRTPFGGSIVNMSSVSGIVGTPHLSCYTATKAGLRFFSKSAAIEFARLGYRLRVNTVHPGLIEGASANVLFDASVRSGQYRDIEEAQAAWTARFPVNRMGRQQDIGGAVLFLASDESNFMTGAELVIDGGLSAQ